MVDAVGDCVTEVEEKLKAEGKGLGRGTGEMRVLAGLGIEDAGEGLKGCEPEGGRGRVIGCVKEE